MRHRDNCNCNSDNSKRGPLLLHQALPGLTRAYFTLGLGCLLVAGTLTSCVPLPSPKKSAQPGTQLPREGDEISICGQLFHTGAPVVMWNDHRGYDAYRLHQHFDRSKEAPSDNAEATARFGSFRRGLSEALDAKIQKEGWELSDLQEVVHQVVLHYDGCGTSKRCFQVLHDIRGLSCHFMVDLDGTIYQTLDLKERAWHAAHANDYSVGIEIANIGAYRDAEHQTLKRWYRVTGDQVAVQIPESQRGHLPHDLRTTPYRHELLNGAIHGVTYHQYDYTPEQYQALVKLLATLCQVFPRIEPRAPRDATGNILATELSAEAMKFEGFVGHYHLTHGKHDPGPAFDWETLVAEVKRELAGRQTR